MTRYPLNLPVDLKQEAEALAKKQGISLNQFIMWSVSEKVASMRSQLDDLRFPLITYRRGGSGDLRPVIRGTGIHVKTIVSWIKFGESPKTVAEEYGLDIKQVQEAQAFYQAHKAEIDADLREEEELEEQHKKEMKKSKGRKNVKAKTASR
ncbi:MAG: DUF433 domain-containing protein [Chloroflexi bacterium]|nr:DUF433 domain-containing protein [Chloroflexota bacterium]